MAILIGLRVPENKVGSGLNRLSMKTLNSPTTVFLFLSFDAEQSENLRLRAELMIEI